MADSGGEPPFPTCFLIGGQFLITEPIFPDQLKEKCLHYCPRHETAHIPPTLHPLRVALDLPTCGPVVESVQPQALPFVLARR
jgi:hypothetical protein